MSKQSNRQTQNVKVVVNNRLGCCEKPKRKRKSKPTQPQENPMEDGGFPALDTPAQNRPSYSAIPVRNTVYMPSSVQITPEGMMPPVPNYFERPYTNLVRTMEDFQDTMIKEWREFQQSANPTAVALQGTQTISRASTPQGTQTAMTPGMDDALTMPPVSNLINTFEAMSTPPSQSRASSSQQPTVHEQTPIIDTPTRKQQEKERRDHYIENYSDAQIDSLYQAYIDKFDIKKIGKPATKKLTQINNILAFEKQYGRISLA